MARNFLDGKGVSAPQKLSDFSKKKISENNDISNKNMTHAEQANCANSKYGAKSCLSILLKKL